MSKNNDRDIVILNSPNSKDKSGGKDFRSDQRNKSSRDSRVRNDRNTSSSSSYRDHHHRDLPTRDSGGHRNGGGGGNLSRPLAMGGDGPSRNTRQPHNAVKFSGMAFTESELLTDIPKKKFTGRCRLFVGNIPNEVKESELRELFVPFGDISECFVSGKGFAFLRLDTRAHAESAKEALDGTTLHNRQIRVRFAVHGATIRVCELAPVVSNEMLHLTFTAFGEVERAVHIVDEKGKPTGEGIVEFERKSAAMEALAQIKERVFLMTANSRPLIAELLEPRDEEDGLAEKMLQRTPQLLKERELGPRFASVNSFEHVYGQKWKELYEMEQKRKAELKLELAEARKRLDADMEIAYEDYKTQLLREDLMRRQQELDRLEAAKRERMQRASGSLGGHLFGGLGGSGAGGMPVSHSPSMDGPLGRAASQVGRIPPFFPGQGPNGGGAPPPPAAGIGGPPMRIGPPLGGAGPGTRGASSTSFLSNNSTPVSSSPSNQGKIDVHKLLQTFKGDGPRNDQMRGGPLDRHPGGGGPGGLPSHLLNIMGPFANALTGHVQARPPHGGIPRPTDAFQPPDKRMRR